jgi:hypothetical protein
MPAKSTEGHEEGEAQLPGIALEVEAYGPHDEGEDIRRLRGTNGNDRADNIDKEAPTSPAQVSAVFCGCGRCVPAYNQ